jgi:hypothetical protein
MPLNNGRTDDYKPQHLYVEDHPLTPDEIRKLRSKENEDDDERGIIIIEIL